MAANIFSLAARIRTLEKDLIPEAKEDKDRLHSIATKSTPSHINDGAKQKIRGNKKEDAFIAYIEAVEKLKNLEIELAGLKLKLHNILDTIKDDRTRRFAKLRFIDGLNQKEISRNTHYAYGTVRNKISEIRKSSDTE